MGKQQRNNYLKQLDSAFHELANNPEIGKRCDEIRDHYLKHLCGKHIIFYKKSLNVTYSLQEFCIKVWIFKSTCNHISRRRKGMADSPKYLSLKYSPVYIDGIPDSKNSVQFCPLVHHHQTLELGSLFGLVLPR